MLVVWIRPRNSPNVNMLVCSNSLHRDADNIFPIASLELEDHKVLHGPA